MWIRFFCCCICRPSKWQFWIFLNEYLVELDLYIPKTEEKNTNTYSMQTGKFMIFFIFLYFFVNFYLPCLHHRFFLPIFMINVLESKIVTAQKKSTFRMSACTLLLTVCLPTTIQPLGAFNFVLFSLHTAWRILVEKEGALIF